MSAQAPDISSMLAAAAAGKPHSIQVGGMAPSRGAMAPSQTGGADAFKSALSQAIDDLHALAGLADDPQDRQDVIKCLQALNGIQATEQKEGDAAMGGKVSPRQMRQAYGQ